MPRGAPPRDGDQLRLELFVGVPWDGRSPRALTKGSTALSLRREPVRAHEVFVDPEQYDLWPLEVSGPITIEGPLRKDVSEGAPLLLEFLLSQGG